MSTTMAALGRWHATTPRVLRARPEYQQLTLPRHTRAALGGHRGIPDISYNADDFNSAILVYISFLGPTAAPASVGYYLIGGTSEGAPQWAGIVADLIRGMMASPGTSVTRTAGP